MKQELLSEFRGEPLLRRIPDEDVPCVETSDAERLCAQPLVSVLMITYNHEPYIAQAIEGVMMQETDFEFELIIGEDASTDRTREICFEYQKRYPERIRVLWSEANVNRLSGNGQRVESRARGKLLAFCEGDDYWTDPVKLQQQVNLLQKYPQAGICFAGTDYYFENDKRFLVYDPDRVPAELLPGRGIAEEVVVGAAVSHVFYPQARHTSGMLIRRPVFDEACEKFYDLMHYRFRFRDTVLVVCITALSDACFYRKAASVYRINDTGITHWGAALLMRDSDIFGMLALTDVFGMSEGRAIDLFADKLVLHWVHVIREASPEERKRLGKLIAVSPRLRKLFLRPHCLLFYCFARFGRLTPETVKIARLFYSPRVSIRKKRIKRMLPRTI